MSLFISEEEVSGIAFRAKRSRNAYLTYDTGDYLNDQTLSTQIEIPVSRFEENSYPADVGEDHISGSTEDTETDCSETDSMESDSDDDMAALSGKIFCAVSFWSPLLLYFLLNLEHCSAWFSVSGSQVLLLPCWAWHVLSYSGTICIIFSLISSLILPKYLLQLLYCIYHSSTDFWMILLAENIHFLSVYFMNVHDRLLVYHLWAYSLGIMT